MKRSTQAPSVLVRRTLASWLSAEPDLVLVSDESLNSRRVRPVPKAPPRDSRTPRRAVWYLCAWASTIHSG
jgi:hypothetical protein